MNGLLCDPDDEESLGRQLQWVAADPARAARVGDAARQTVAAHSWDVCASATLQIYERVGTTCV
jgi:glycosyltransferase involved in cell wall biosynthesis